LSPLAQIPVTGLWHDTTDYCRWTRSDNRLSRITATDQAVVVEVANLAR
jgi:hypothetical protein